MMHCSYTLVYLYSYLIHVTIFLLQVADLKEKLKEKGLTVSGTKPELLKRLKDAMELEGMCIRDE